MTLLTLAVSGFTRAGDFSRGLLWEVSGKGPQASYVLGTIHSDDSRVTTIPVQIQTALYKARSFSAELDLDLGAMITAQAQMMLPPDKDLQTIVGQQRYNKAVQYMMDYGMPELVVSRMKPWAVAAQLMLPKPTTGVFLDLKLYQEAQSRGIKTYGLETVDEQMSVFESMSNSQQIAMLDQSIREYKNMPAMISQLTQLYLNRDLAGMQRFSDEQMRKSDRTIADMMEKTLINDRNARMVQRMETRFHEGAAFIAIGALHLPGDKGVLQLLENRGYKLRALY